MIPRWLLVLAGVALATAIATAAYWILELGAPPPVGPAGTVGLFLMLAAVTVLFLGLRWLRWHYLVRRFSHAVRARDSLVLYAATLPALLTPFAAGELIRVFALRRRAPSAVKYLVLVWFLERFTDLAFVVALALAAAHPSLAVIALSAAAAGLVAAHLWLTRSSPSSLLGFAPVALALTTVQWALPVVALWALLGELGVSTRLIESASALGGALFLGGLSGLPMGAGVTSSSLILEIDKLDAPEGVAIVAGAMFRVGTAWFAALLGFLLFALLRRPLFAIIRETPPHQHFDTIAGEYEELIPEHVRARLLNRKIDAMTRVLGRSGCPPGAKGLDVGCGQAPYAIQLAKLGYSMAGVEASQGQLAAARERAAREGVSVSLESGSAEALPFPTGSFDFVYLINVIHHVPGRERRARALAECVRVLRPGGVLFLHEINTQNPLFRFYMGYVFPLLRKIDDGTEEWILPAALPDVPGHRWSREIVYFTFLPEFIPKGLLASFSGLERWLESSSLRRYSAHFMAYLQKETVLHQQETETRQSEAVAP